MEPLLGQIIMFAGNFAPRGWAFCDGQLLSINENQALFSLLGTNYGGDGRTTFGLPDLRGRVSIHEGQGPGLPNYVVGQKGNLSGGLVKYKLGSGMEETAVTPYTTVSYIIALQGIYPSRN